jgi:mRNA interferase MazF
LVRGSRGNVGFEQDGRGVEFLRPTLIIRKFNNQILWGVPLTRTSKPESPYYVGFHYAPLPKIESAPLEASVGILSQMRLINSKRLRYKIGTVHADELNTIKERIRRLLV